MSMNDLKSIYLRLCEKKRENREIKREIRNELERDGEYMEVSRQLRVLRLKKKAIEDRVKLNVTKNPFLLDTLRKEINAQSDLLSDIAFAKYMEKENVEIKDEAENVRLVPTFKVKYKKEMMEYFKTTAEAERAASHPERTYNHK